MWINILICIVFINTIHINIFCIVYVHKYGVSDGRKDSILHFHELGMTV